MGSRSVAWKSCREGFSVVALLASLAGCQSDPRKEAGAEATSRALNAAPKIGDFVLEAKNSIRLQTGGVTVGGGDIGARGSGSGPFLSGGVAIDLLTGVQAPTNRNVIADSIRLGTGVTVGDLQTNRLVDGTGTHHGPVTGLVPLPDLPLAAPVSPGTTSLTVSTGGTLTASPGSYAAVSVGTGGKLRLNGGSYDFASLSIGTGARLEILGPVVLHIQGRLGASTGAFLGAAAGVTATARDLRIEVSGINGSTGALGATPPAAAIGTGANVTALILVPNGSLVAGTTVHATGAFIARDLDFGGAGAVITFQDGFDCVGVPDGVLCDDGNLCTRTDTCQAGACVGGNPAPCDVSDPCSVGVCDPATGACAVSPKPDGAECSDGDLCTRGDLCTAGVCVGGSPVECAASDQCHDPGACDPASGLCSDPQAGDGRACDDGNLCTQFDICEAGVCNGHSPLLCVANDQCHDAGTCVPDTGACSNPAKPDGTSCDDGAPCTQTDTCQAGACVGGDPVICAAPDQCHDVGTCDATTGTCSNPVKADGSPCSDGNLCTRNDSCQGGTCVDGDPVSCAAPDQCHDLGACDAATGICSNPAKTDGSSCTDGNLCTRSDTCQGGACVGGDPVACPTDSLCPTQGTCDPNIGRCLWTTDPVRCGNGSVEECERCDDGNTVDGDGCSATCQFETCASGSSSRALQALTFMWLGRSCGASPPAEIIFTLNGAELARAPLTNSCECMPGPGLLEVSDPNVLAMARSGNNVFGVQTTGELAWVVAMPQTPGQGWEPWVEKIWDVNGKYDPSYPWYDNANYDPSFRTADLCTEGAQAGVSATRTLDLAGGGRCPVCGNRGTENGSDWPELGEDCDDGNLTDGDGCSASCKFETCQNGASSRTYRALSFSWLGHSCDLPQPADIIFTLDGTEVARAPLAISCACSGTVETLHVTDLALLSLAKSLSHFGVRSTGQVAWAGAYVGSANDSYFGKIFDASGNWDQNAQAGNLCDANLRAGAFASIPIGAGQSACGICGDGVLQAGEDCDDGNQTNGDGCSTGCHYETCASGESSRALLGLAFSWLGRSCGPAEPADIVFRLDGIEVARAPLAQSCDCEPGIGTAVVSDPRILDRVPSDHGGITVSTRGEIAWVMAHSRTYQGSGDWKMWDISGDWDAAHQPGNLCTTGAQVGLFASTGVGLYGGGRCGTCGNGSTEYTEQCDDGNLIDGDTCSSICQFGACPDGKSSRALQSLKFNWLGRSCGSTQPADVVFTIDGNEVGRAPLANSCDCAPGIGTLEVSDPSLLALGKSSGNAFGVQTTGELGWATMEYQTPTTSSMQKLWDAGGDGDPTHRPEDLCGAGASKGVYNLTWASPEGGGRCGPCGNNVVEPPETCDDGNTISGDGCSWDCRREFCGDGTVQPPLRALKFTYLGRSCGAAEPADVVFSLGETEMARMPLPDTCDCAPGVQTVAVTDPDLLAQAKNGDYAFHVRTTGELAWAVMDVRTPTAETRTTLWDAGGGGDAEAQTADLCAAGAQPDVTAETQVALSGGEECDDGNTNDEDSCSNSCQRHSCTDPALCGNGVVDACEECDDGNAYDGDGCTATCQYGRQGDGILERPLRSLALRWLGRSCGLDPPADIVFLMNDHEVARVPLPNTCDCEPGIQTVAVTDWNLLALAAKGVNQFGVRTSGELAWAQVGVGMRDWGDWVYWMYLWGSGGEDGGIPQGNRIFRGHGVADRTWRRKALSQPARSRRA